MSCTGIKMCGRILDHKNNAYGHTITLPKEEEWLEICQLTMVKWFHTNVVWVYVKTNVGWV